MPKREEIFEAFLAIYKRRVADLIRIASGGTGILPEGEIHPDLVSRLAREAVRGAYDLPRVAAQLAEVYQAAGAFIPA